MTMNLDVYIASLQRTAANLPRVLLGWAELDDELQQHYADELVRLLAERDEAIDQGRGEGRTDFAWTASALAAQYGAWAALIRAVVGIDILPLVTGPGTTVDAPTGDMDFEGEEFGRAA